MEIELSRTERFGCETPAHERGQETSARLVNTTRVLKQKLISTKKDISSNVEGSLFELDQNNIKLLTHRAAIILCCIFVFCISGLSAITLDYRAHENFVNDLTNTEAVTGATSSSILIFF